MSKYNLPTLDKTNKELEACLEENFNDYLKFYSYEQASVTPNNHLTLSQIASNELRYRSNNKQVKYSFFLSVTTVLLATIAIIFALLDFTGDEDWKNEQLKELKSLNQNYSEIEVLKNQINLLSQENKIMARELENFKKTEKSK